MGRGSGGSGKRAGIDWRSLQRKNPLSLTLLSSPFPLSEARAVGKGAGGIGIFLTLALPTQAAPPRHHHPTRPPHAHAQAKAAAKKPAKPHAKAAPAYPPISGDALWASGGALPNPPAPSDAQALVNTGKVPPYYNAQHLEKSPILDAPSAILIDADTGQVLWGKNPTLRRFPASTTKILTALLFIEHTQPGDIVTCLDPKITQIEPSSLYIKPWEKFTAQDLLYGTLLRSGNDGAVVMAEYVSGSVGKFADLMNARAAQIGATDSHWVTPNGLHDREHYTTARDMAKIARVALQNPRFADAVSQPEREITRTINVKDSLIIARAHKYWDRFPGADGVKTGYTHQAGHCFVGTATRDGRRLLAVIFGARNSAVDNTVPLLSYGFARWEQTPLARAGDPAASVPVRGGLAGDVATVAGANLHVSYDALRPMEDHVVTTSVEPVPGLAAPVRAGDIVGQLVGRLNGKAVARVPLRAASDVARSPIAAAMGGGHGGSLLRAILLPMGGVGLVLVAWRWYATTTAKSARRRRSRLATARGGDDRRR